MLSKTMKLGLGLMSGTVIFALSGCGQTGPLYPSSELSQPQHHYDTFLLVPDKSTPAQTQNTDQQTSKTTTSGSATNQGASKQNTSTQ